MKMYKKDVFLTPIKEKLPPPHHTRIKPRCFTCKKIDTCSIFCDYMKTAQLLQNIIGKPCENLCLKFVPQCYGITILECDKFLPHKIMIEEKESWLYGAKYKSMDEFNIIYKRGEYLVNFNCLYNKPLELISTTPNEEELFTLFNFDKYTYPPVTETETLKVYHALPMKLSIYGFAIDEINNIIRTIENGEFKHDINISILAANAGDYDETGVYRYPTKEETEEEGFHFLQVNAKLTLNLKKEGNELKLQNIQNPIVLVPGRGDTDPWNRTFKEKTSIPLTLEQQSQIFELIKTMTVAPKFKVGKGKEIVYGTEYEIDEQTKENLNVSLLKLRKFLEDELNKQKTIINTTAFNVKLDCKHYEWNNYSFEDSICHLVKKHPHGIPIDDKTYYHIATFHIEDGEVPCYHPENGYPVLAPMPYPVYIPPKKEHKCKPQTRFEKNEF